MTSLSNARSAAKVFHENLIWMIIHSAIATPPSLRVMCVITAFTRKAPLNVMCVPIVKNIRIEPTRNPAKYQAKDSQTTEIQASLNLAITMKNLLKVRIAMQALHQQQHQIST